MQPSLLLAAFLLLSSLASPAAAPGDRKAKVLGDRAKTEQGGDWIYNDLPGGFAEAKKTGKPMFVVLRCIPCVNCSLFDESVVNRDPKIRALMEKFVTVRIIQGNGLDLSLFQFDFDLSFGAFFMNADRTIYGRFGTRTEDQESRNAISIESLGKAMEAALELHQGYPANKALFTGKNGPAPANKTPETMPGMQGKYGPTLDFEGQVVQSCIHCHMVRDAQRRELRAARQPFSDQELFPWPLPQTVGLTLDPREKATVASVAASSAAAKAGFQAGDDIAVLNGQPILSIADVQWVLHNAAEPAQIAAEVKRGGKTVKLNLALASGWRRAADISWRPTSWELRRMAFGGMKMDDLPAADRAKLGLADNALALKLAHVGQYGEHALAKQAGFIKDDIILSVDGRTQRMTESELFAYILQGKPVGAKLPAVVLRNGQRLNLQIPTQ